MASHENDHGEVRLNHAMKNVDWVHRGQGGFARLMVASSPFGQQTHVSFGSR